MTVSVIELHHPRSAEDEARHGHTVAAGRPRAPCPSLLPVYPALVTWRGLGALLLLTLVGGGAGFGGATLLDRPPTASGTPRPMAASGPAYPYTPPIEVLPDPEDPPPLRAPFDTREDTLGGGPFAVTFPVPVGWQRTNTAPGEARWTLTDNPPHSYSVRVELVGSQTRTAEQQIALRITDLQSAAGIADLRVVGQSSNQLIFSFVMDRHRRVSVIRWVSPRGGTNAEVEIAATGRVTDQGGLEDLVGLLAAEVRPAVF